MRLVCVMGDGRGMPCGACREFMMQLDKDSPALKYWRTPKPGKRCVCGELMPHWWGAGGSGDPGGGRPPALTGRDGPHGRAWDNCPRCSCALKTVQRTGGWL